MARATWYQTPVLVPARSPARAPAAETSWHGKPAVSKSTEKAYLLLQSILVRSPRLGTSGNRCFRIFEAPTSRSATATRSTGNRDSSASSIPPYPEQSEITRIWSPYAREQNRKNCAMQQRLPKTDFPTALHPCLAQPGPAGPRHASPCLAASLSPQHNAAGVATPVEPSNQAILGSPE